MTRESLLGVLRTLGAAAVLVMLTGCTGAPEGTGKRGELYIHLPGEVAAGLPFTLMVPDRRKVDVGDSSEDDYRFDHWDFAATRLEVSAPAGLDFAVEYRAPASNPNELSGYLLRARCDASPDGGHEVHLRVLSNSGSVRYEDAFDVSCVEPTGMRVSDATGAPVQLAGQRFFTGGGVSLAVQLLAGDRALQYEGLQLQDRKGILRQREPLDAFGTVLFELAAAGSTPELSYRGAVHPLPIEVVDDPDWTLELGAWQLGQSSFFHTLTPIARGSDGLPLGGLHACSWQLWFGPSRVETRSSCNLNESSGRPTRSCLSAHGRTACREDP